MYAVHGFFVRAINYIAQFRLPERVCSDSTRGLYLITASFFLYLRTHAII